MTFMRGVSVMLSMVLLSTAGLLTVATSAGQPTTQALNTSCNRYQDSSQKSLCQQLLAKLQQNLPAGGVRLDASGGVLSSTQYHHQPTDDKPSYQEDKDHYQHSEYDGDEYYGNEYERSAEDKPHGYDKDPSDGPPGYYGHEPQTPSSPLYSAVETDCGMSLVPKSSTSLNASGLLTQNDFTYWDSEAYPGSAIRISRRVKVSLSNITDPYPGGDYARSVSVWQVFECAAPMVFDYKAPGQVWSPTTLTVRCKMVPSAAEVYAGAQFPWHQAMQPRWAVTVPNPTQFGYSVYRSDEEYYYYDAEVHTMDSPVAFTGSIVDLMLDALFARPTEYTFSVKANNFVPWGKRRDMPPQGAVPSPCDKLTIAAQKLRCQQQTNKTALLLRQGSLGTRAALPGASGAATVLGERYDYAGDDSHAPPHYYTEAGGDKYGDSSPQKENPAHPLEPSITLIPQTSSRAVVYVEASDNVINAEGDLTSNDFADVVVALERNALLSDKLNSLITPYGLIVQQTSSCVAPVKFHFSGPVRQPDDLRVKCKMEAEYARIIVMPKVPWAQAAEEGNQVLIPQPKDGFYIVSHPELGDVFKTYVASMKFQPEPFAKAVPFTGSINDLLMEALYGKPAEFPFEAYLVVLM